MVWGYNGIRNLYSIYQKNYERSDVYRCEIIYYRVQD